MLKTPMRNYLRNCPKIIFAFDTFLYDPFYGSFWGVLGGCTKTMVKKVIHFLTHKEHPYVEDSNEQNCPKLSESEKYF